MEKEKAPKKPKEKKYSVIHIIKDVNADGTWTETLRETKKITLDVAVNWIEKFNDQKIDEMNRYGVLATLEQQSPVIVALRQKEGTEFCFFCQDNLRKMLSFVDQKDNPGAAETREDEQG